MGEGREEGGRGTRTRAGAGVYGGCGVVEIVLSRKVKKGAGISALFLRFVNQEPSRQ